VTWPVTTKKDKSFYDEMKVTNKYTFYEDCAKFRDCLTIQNI